MAELRFGVLGTLEVTVDGQALRVPPGRRRAVLACLLVHLGRPASADVLIEAAWGAELPADSRATLNTVLSRLRAQLGAEVITADPGGYRLHADPDAVDSVRFETLLSRAGSAAPARAYADLTHALGLWRGTAYGEYADAPFATVEAGRLEELRRQAVEACAQAAIDCGRPGDAVNALQELLAEEPFRERTVELAMLALYRTGRQSDALAQFTDYRRRLAAELGLDPSPALARLHSRVLGHRLASIDPEPAAVPTWLDTSTAFIGREPELAEVVSAVAADRVTVLTGPGGVGKSRLAAEALAPLQAQLGLPIVVAELVGARTGQATAVLTDALGLRSQAADPTPQIVEYLDGNAHLLVLDNCEHLLDELRPLVARIAGRTRDTRVLATSRHRLGVLGESVLPLGPLALPELGVPAGTQQLSAAVRLIADRVRRINPAFAVTDASVPLLAELCRQFDGLPLALELAAARVATVGPEQALAERPSNRLGERTPSRPAPERGTDLRAAITWSYDLLDAGERQLLASLSIFPGEFTLEAVQPVMAGVPGWQTDVADALAELVESSLVSARYEGTGASYRLLATVRAFAADRLDADQASETVHLAHATWVRSAVTRIAADWASNDGAEVSARLTRCSADVSAALGWALDTRRTQLASDIAGAVARCFHWTPGPVLRTLIIGTADLGMEKPSAAVAGGVAAGGFCYAEQGDLIRARELGMAALRMSADPDTAVTAWTTLGVAAMYSGDMTEASRCFDQVSQIPGFATEGHTSLALAACYSDRLEEAREHAAIALTAGPSGSEAASAFARYAAGEVALRTGDDQGVPLLQQAVEEALRIDAEQVLRVARIALLAVLVRRRRHRESIELGRLLLDDLRRRGVWPQIWTTLRLVAEILADLQHPADAAFLLGAAASDPAAPPPAGPDIDRYAALRARLVTEVGERVHTRIEQLAASTPRARVLIRAEHLLSDLANALDEKDRRAVTDSGSLPPDSAAAPGSSSAPGAAFGLSGGAAGFSGSRDGVPADDVDPFDDLFDDDDLDLLELWPDFLGKPPHPETGVAAMQSADPRALLSTALTQRADQLMALLGDVRPLTGTKGLRQADLNELLPRLGIERTARSMWDVPELTLLWIILQSAGFVEVRGSSAYPAAAGVAWVGPDGDLGPRLLSVRLLHAAGLAVLLGLPDDEESRTASPLIHPALLKAAEPDGLTVSLPDDPDGVVVAADLLEDLSAMVQSGLLEQVGEQTYHLHPALLELTPTAMDAARAEDDIG